MTTPRWFDPKITIGNVIQIILIVGGLFGAYYGIIGKIESQAAVQADQGRDIDSLKAAVAPIPGISSHISVIDTTISINKAARDKAMDELSARVDKLTDVVTLMSQNVAALTATIKASENHR